MSTVTCSAPRYRRATAAIPRATVASPVSRAHRPRSSAWSRVAPPSARWHGRSANAVAGASTVNAAPSARGERTAAVADLQLGRRAPDPPLDHRPVDRRVQQVVASEPDQRASGRQELVDAADGCHHGLRDRPALGLVAVEQGGFGAPSDHEGELEGEVLRVPDSGVHSLSAGGAVDVCGVAGQQHTSVPIRRGQPAVNPEGRGPRHTPDSRNVAVDPVMQNAGEQLQNAFWGVRRRSRRTGPAP